MNLSIGASSLNGLRPLSSTDGGRDRDRFGAHNFVYTQSKIRQKVKQDFGANVALTTRESEFRPVSKKSKSQEYGEMPPSLVDDRPSLTSLLTNNTLLIKYKRGDKEIPKLKKSLKKGGDNKLVQFRTDRTLEWAPQYFIDGQLTNLSGYLNGELLRNNIIDQLDEWEEARKAEEEAAARAEEESSSESESEDESDGMTDDESENASSDEDEDEDDDANDGDAEDADAEVDTEAEAEADTPITKGLAESTQSTESEE